MRYSGALRERSQGALAPPKKKEKEINVATELIQELCKKKRKLDFIL